MFYLKPFKIVTDLNNLLKILNFLELILHFILKVFLNLIFEKILNLLFFYFFVFSTYTIVNLNTVYKVSDSTKQKTSEPIKLLFEKGIGAYE